MGCGPMPDWLRKRHCIYAVNTFDDNLCVWRCLAIYKRHACGETNQVSKRNYDAALGLTREYYGDNKLKKMYVRPTRLVDFEGIAKYHNVNIMLQEPKKDRGKDAGSIWRLVYGKAQHKNSLTTINMGLLGGYCSYSKKMDVLCKRCECKCCRQIFTKNEDLTVHLKEERCTGGKTSIICPGGKFKHILNSSEKVFYGGETKFSYTTCQWTQKQVNTFIVRCVDMVENAW